MSSLLVWIVVGGIAGYLASRILRGRGMGLPMDIVVGLLGGVLGGFLANQAGIAVGGVLREVVVAFVGAFLLLSLARLVFTRGRFSRL